MKTKHSFRAAFFYAFLILLGIVSSTEAGRPLNTDDAGVVSAGALELETAYEYVGSTDNENNLSTVLTTGIVDGLDIGVEWPYQFIDVAGGGNQNGLSDIGITAKWNFYVGDSLETTLSFNYKSDTGDDDNGLGTGEPEYTILGILSKQFSDVVVHLNLGPTIIEDGSDILNYLIASEWALSEQLSLVAEVFGSTPYEGDFDDNPFSGLVGFVYAISDSAVFDFGVGFGISDADPDFTITSGFTFEFGGK